ncbi:tRNA dimethylallyltransferase-like protein [Leptotrombidium deliense]|uniref:tRNA dimethylallyltransferase-like protein n=1 Tax=Leptotrombidium deliense TaxID=299467 RepID=A0A443SS23_9ACAR|nr:tRNA dimethylallyltransferase-like protein [Leptotrombidium deliense]
MSLWRLVSSCAHFALSLSSVFSSKLFKMQANKPVIVILGATGTGKTKLSLDLAQHFDCEVISADSMQIYKGLDIVTNKVTPEERSLVPHHLIDYIDPLISYTVVDYRNKSLPILNSLLEKNKLPIIVGGTIYFIESLLWNVLITSEEDNNCLIKEKEKQINSEHSSQEIITKENIKNFIITQETVKHLSNEYLYNLLKEIDPQGCAGLHWNTRRKVIRRLQIFQQHGKTYSELIAEQKSINAGCAYGGPLRLKNCVILWLQCDRSILRDRIFKRVDQMIENGLVEELLQFHELYNQTRFEENKNADYTEGIFQSIGFKEFHRYLILDKESRESKKGRKIFEECTERMKYATFRYAKWQEKWIVNRLLRSDRVIPPIFGLNTSDLTQWQQNVTNIAIEIVKSHVKGTPLPTNIVPMEKEVSCEDNTPEERRRLHHCDICERLIVGTKNWKMHLKSRKHYNVVNSRKRLCALLDERAEQLKAMQQI